MKSYRTVTVNTYALIGSNGGFEFGGVNSALFMTFCVSQSIRPEKTANPPQTEIEYNPAPIAEVGGRNAPAKTQCKNILKI